MTTRYNEGSHTSVQLTNKVHLVKTMHTHIFQSHQFCNNNKIQKNLLDQGSLQLEAEVGIVEG